MAAARARLLEASKPTQQEAAAQIGVSQQRISQANVVLDHASELADAVLAGAKPLDEASEEARRRKSAASSEIARMERLREAAPDLADQVTEERLGLTEAVAALHVRKFLTAAALLARLSVTTSKRRPAQGLLTSARRLSSSSSTEALNS